MAIYRGPGGATTTSDTATIDTVNEKAAEAANSAASATSSASTATTKASEASASAITASTKATEAAASATTASTKASEATTALSDAITAEAAAENAQVAAEASETNAASSETNALNYKNDAETAKNAAATSATSAATSATTATTKAAEASTSESNAATSATNAATSETNAATSATNAATSATNAETHKTNAELAKTAAQTAKTQAETAKTAAETAQTAAETAQTGAETAETNAETAQTAAETAQAAAEAAKTAAETAETNATSSKNTAVTKASEASTSAANAATSATQAATSATNAAASYDSFDDRYLGAKATAPTVDNDGDALLTGALYYDTTDSAMKVYSGSVWLDAYASLSGALLSTNNLADLGNVTSARDNLDLGTSDTPTFAEVNVDFVDLKTTGSSPAHAEGRIFYDNTNDALAVYNSESDITLQVGQEEYIRVYNDSGATIANGTPVYITGEANDYPTIAKAAATTEAGSQAVGLATHSIENATFGFVTVRGLVGDLDTSSLTVGNRVHVGTTAGTLQETAPTYPYFPVDIGICLISSASAGCVYVDVQSHNFEVLRVTGDARVDDNLTVGGDLTVLGTQTIASSNNVSIGSAWNYFNSGDTIGESNTTFTGSGLDDGVLTGHFEGTASKSYYVAIDGTGTPDTFKWSYNSDLSSPEATGVSITGSDQELGEGISIKFNATTGHTSGDKWSGTASPVNVDSGISSNRNTGGTGVGYTHMGIFFDVSDEKWKFFEEYDPEPTGTINTAHASYNAATVVADTFEGNLTGGTVSATSYSGGNVSNWNTAYGWGDHASISTPTVGATTTLDFDANRHFIVNLNQNTTFAFSNATAGQSGVIYLKQDATGGRTFTLPAAAKTPVNGAAIVQATGANEISILSYAVLDSSNVLVNYVGDFA